MTSASAKHLVTVWNPSYSASAIDAHLEVLLGWSERWGRGEASADDVYVWWGKLRSENRQQPLSHLPDILDLQAQVDRGTETHLYLTDYRSLYVGHVEEIASGSLLEEFPGESDHMPAYYDGRAADCWFLLGDLRLLVADDTPAVIEELKKLRNVRYHDRPVSLYGGMVELPLLVRREETVPWFADRELLSGGRLWAEHDGEFRGETERMAREVRENLLGEEVWEVLEPATRTFVATAEAIFRTRRDDPRFDFSGPAVEYAKAVETELNALVFPVVRRVMSQRRPAEREVRLDGRPLDLGIAVGHQTLGALKTLLEHADPVGASLRAALPHDFSWLLSVLPQRLGALASLRNPAAHSASSRREEVRRAREEVLGIGQEGLLVRIARAKMRAR